jgi:CubicO group peptidase (beta-lactamase class C family)
MFGATPAKADYAAAAAYSRTHNGVAMVVMSGDAVVFENYVLPTDRFISWKIYSGTKAITGLLAAAAAQDGLIASVDDFAATYLPEWADDPVKSTVRIRHLLNLSSGMATPSVGEGESLTFAQAVALPFNALPEEQFVWGAGGYQAFGEIVRRRLVEGGDSVTDPMLYFYNKVMKPIGAEAPMSVWLKAPDGHVHLATGARLMARSWALLGALVRRGGAHNGTQLLAPAALAALDDGSAAHPGFGLGFGKPYVLPPEQIAEGGIYAQTEIWLPDPEDYIPDDMLAGAGAGRQRLYIVPSRNLVVVRLAARGFSGYENFNDREFWRLLLAP